MKALLIALSLSAALFGANASAASSVCSVFVDIAPANDFASYAVYATCDGKSTTHLDYTDGMMAPLTKVVQGLLAKGYSLTNCSGNAGTTQCFLTK